jgi:uncharacterized protein (TIGR00299 family) protein
MFALIDPAAGISGDMLLGALIDAGAPEAWLRDLPGRLAIPEVQVAVDKVDRCGVRCTKVTVRLPGGVEGPGDVAYPGDGQGASHHAGHGHRHVGALIRMVESAPLSPWVRERAVQAFRLLGEAEGRVHGKAWDKVALHEVGALDALVDIVGAIEGFERLGIVEIFTRPVALGDGWVRAAHGVLPVPAPATALLAEGLEVAPNGPVQGEATTPTGAALLRVLAAGGLPRGWRPVRSGWGAGSRDPAAYPNALRLMIAEGAPEAAEVSVLAADLDDMSPEYLQPLRESLVAAGALDVQMWATQMKKGRIGIRVEAMVPAGREAEAADAFFANSTTAGIRWTRAERRTLARRQVQVTGQDGSTFRVKVLETPSGAKLKPEFDDVARAAQATGRAAIEVAAEVRSLAQRQEAEAATRQDIVHKESR